HCYVYSLACAHPAGLPPPSPTRRASDLLPGRELALDLRRDRLLHRDHGLPPRELAQLPHRGAHLGLLQARAPAEHGSGDPERGRDRKSTRLNSSHVKISYAVFCLTKKR